jgi:putative tricarboxylic transport membrane protein
MGAELLADGFLAAGLLDGIQRLLDPTVIAAVFLAAVFGVFVGAVPGLTATMAVALFVPLAFFLDAHAALAAIVALEACAIFAGDIPAALLRIPGTPASAAYADDAFALTCAGRSRDALGSALIFSVLGGLFGALVLTFAAPQIARVAFEFSSVEYFWLTLLGLGCAVVVSRGSFAAGVVSLSIGLLLSTVGLSPVHSAARFTLGRDELIAGVGFIPAMIGLFGISEAIRNALRIEIEPLERTRAVRLGRTWLLEPLRAAARRPAAFLRSGVIGSFIGILPGAGADIAAWVSYAVSKRRSKRPDDYGRGSIEGLSDATTANNAALAGAWVPALVLGIPGDSVTAIVLGVLMMKNITPGPGIFEKNSELVGSIYGSFFIANLVLVPVGAIAIIAARRWVEAPRRLLLPVIVLFSIVGSYAISGSYFDVALMLGLGVLGFVLEATGIPLGPAVLGLILGSQIEERFIQSWIKSASWQEFFGDPFGTAPRPWACGLALATVLLWLGPVVWPIVRRTVWTGPTPKPPTKVSP